MGHIIGLGRYARETYPSTPRPTGGGSGSVKTQASLTHASAPYTILPTDVLIEVDTSGGVLAGPINLSALPLLQEITIKCLAWISTIQSFLVTGGGTPIENVQAPGALASTFVVGDVNGPSPGGSLTFLFDGTKILVTGTV